MIPDKQIDKSVDPHQQFDLQSETRMHQYLVFISLSLMLISLLLYNLITYEPLVYITIVLEMVAIMTIIMYMAVSKDPELVNDFTSNYAMIFYLVMSILLVAQHL